MTGGGWTLLLKATADSTFRYSSPLWTNDEVLAADDLTTSAGNSKYPAFVSLPVTELRACFPTQEGYCFSATLTGPGTALAVFSGGFQSFGGYDQQFYSGWSTQPNCKTFGINTPYRYQRVRFGFTANQEGDCNSNDTAAGLGVEPGCGGGGSKYGAGAVCLSSKCSKGNMNAGFPGLLWGR